MTVLNKRDQQRTAADPRFSRGHGGDVAIRTNTRDPRVRHPAAASQQAFEHARANAGFIEPPPGPRASGHIDAARIAATLDGAAVTTQAAAHAFDLRFLALEDHTVEIWLAARWRDLPASTALAELLSTAAFTQRVAQFGGYDLTDCGITIQAAGHSSRLESRAATPK